MITSGTGMGNAVPVNLQPKTISIPTIRIRAELSEVAGAAVAERGVNVSVVRLPQVHDTVKQGLITTRS